MMSFPLALLAMLLSLLLLPPPLADSSLTSTPYGLNDDVLGLIVFKADLLDPGSRLSSWSEDDDSPCSWTGVECDARTGRVARLSLPSSSLSGRIGRGLLQLRSLRSLSLPDNNLSGPLPPDLLRLGRLRDLDLSDNALSGPIPEAFFSQCGSARSVSLARNALSGVLPPGVGSCPTLASLDLSSNRLSGPLPSTVWSLTALRSLDVSGNALAGEVPVGIGRMYNLRRISLRGNRLSSPLPGDLGDAPLLESVDFSENSLAGGLPGSMRNLSLCSFLSLSRNSLSGEVPSWIGGLRSLRTLDLSGNGFSGRLPDSLGSLHSLKELNLSRNALTGSLPESMAAIRSLVDVDLSRNGITGGAPSWIFEPGYRSVSLSENRLSGSVSVETSAIAAPTLRMLDLSGNALSGDIPMEISGVHSLLFLNLSSNSFSGNVPASIRDLKSLEVLDVSRNRLNGSIPPQIGEAASLRELNLEKNYIAGRIPAQIGNCSLLTSLDLSENNLTGLIPSAMAKLKNLRTVDLSVNQLTGTLPKPLSDLRRLLSFNVSHNLLSGSLPPSDFFDTISPSSLSDNAGLCGAAANRSCPPVVHKPIVMNPNSSSPPSSSGSAFPSASHKRIILSISALVAIAAAVTIILGVVAVTVLNIRVRASTAATRSAAALELSGSHLSQSPTSEANSGKLVMFSGDGPEHFSAGAHALLNKDCELGRGGFGAVYKSSLGDGRPVAIKKLTVSSLVKSREDFEKAVGKLGRISHPNLVALRGYYWTPSLQLLVHEFVPGGSLHERLHGPSSPPLAWRERLDALLGAARGLAHLHRLDAIHYNLKSSNVLLDGSGEAKVSGYGLARLLPMLDRYVLGSKYAAPEFGCGSAAGLTEKCDVYGFGMLVLEAVTGRRPVEYAEGGVVALRDVARGAVEGGRAEELVDGRLGTGFPVEEAVPVVRLGLVCTSPVPSSRPDMGEVVNVLEMIRCPRTSTGRYDLAYPDSISTTYLYQN